MSRARDNIQSNRSRDDIDRDAEVRSETQRLRLELLHTQDAEKFQAIQQRMAEIALDKRTPIKTAVQAGAAHQRAVIGLVQNPPQVTINQGAVIDAAGLLRLVDPEGVGHTTGCGPALSAPSDTISLPNPPPSDDPCPRGAVVAGGCDPADGPPAGVSSAPAPEATPPALCDGEYTPAPPPPQDADQEPERGTRAWAEWAVRHPEPAPAEQGLTRCPRCGARTDDEPGHDAACLVPKEEA